MFLASLYFILACLVANYYGRIKTIHYWWAFFFSFFFGIIIGIGICIASKEKNSIEDFYNERKINKRIINILLLFLLISLWLFYHFYLIDKDNGSIISLFFKSNYLPIGLLTGIIGLIIYELRAITFSSSKSVSINRQIDGLIVLVLTSLFFIITRPEIPIVPLPPSSFLR